MDIKKKILSDTINKWIFDHSPQDTYLVGGYIRDILRGEMPADKDFVLKGDAERIARRTAKKFGGRVIDLHNKQTIRITLHKRRSIDFSSFKNEIMDDLQSRDFTINAIAWSPGSGILFPGNFVNDLEGRVVRLIKPQNFLDDPLRILRAYRLAAQLDFNIQVDTRGFLKKYSKKVASAAPERITEELFKLLNCKNALNYLKLCAIDNVLSKIIVRTNSNIRNNLYALELLDKLLLKYQRINSRPNLNNHLCSELSQGLKNIGLIRLYLLLRAYNKKAKRIYETATALNIMNNQSILRFSTRIQKSLYSMEKAEAMCISRMTDRGLYRIFKGTAACIYEIAIIHSLKKSRSQNRIIQKAEEFLYKSNNTLINGSDIKRMLGIDSGRLIGEIKDSVCQNHFLGNIYIIYLIGHWKRQTFVKKMLKHPCYTPYDGLYLRIFMDCSIIRHINYAVISVGYMVIILINGFPS
jgi:tRNA nucleotidyltransferase/poly(A) polymerase